MSTKMSEADWDVALEVFRASLPRRGAKARNDRLFRMRRLRPIDIAASVLALERRIFF